MNDGGRPGRDLLGAVAQLKAGVRLPAVVAETLPLRRSGRDQVARCPFHAERTPSFHVYPTHFHCYGCGAHGDVFDWLRLTRNMTLPEGVAHLEGGGTRWAAPLTSPVPGPAPRAADAADYARRIVAESRPIAGTLAERYLRQHRGIAGPLPPELLFHPAAWSRETQTTHPALVLAAWEDDQVRRVQVVLLDPTTGAKARLHTPKRTFGREAAHVPATLAARAGAGPVLMCEGPEDGIALWSLTGLRTLVAFGGGSLDKLALPAGTDATLCADADDAGRAATRRAAAALVAGGCRVRIAVPIAAKDFNQVLQEQGAAAVLAALERAQTFGRHGLPAFYPAPTEPGAAALARQRAVIAGTIAAGAQLADVSREIARHRAQEKAKVPDWDALTPAQKGAISKRARREVLARRGMARLERPARLLVTGSQGSGKTRTAIEAVAAIRGDAVVWMTQPTLEKADEVAADYAQVRTATSLPALVVRGRAAQDPGAGEQKAAMCPRFEVVTRAAIRGVEVRAVICTSCPLRPREHHRGCGYLDQERRIATVGERGVFLASRAYCFIPSPAPHPDILIADETIVPEAVEPPIEVDPELLRDPMPYRGHDLAAVMAVNATLHRLREALVGPAPLRALREVGVTAQELRAARQALDEALAARPLPRVDGRMTDEAIHAALDEAEGVTLGAVPAVVAAVLRELPHARETLTGVVYDPARRVKVGKATEERPRLVVHRLKQLRGVGKHTTVVLLDGTGSAELNARLVPGLRNEHIPVERDATVIGTSGKSYSRQSLTGCDRHGEAIAGRVGPAQRLREEIRTITAAAPAPAVVIATKQAADMLRSERVVPEADDVSHFGRVRGLNAWEACESAVVVGRESVSIPALEAMARAFLAADPAPFVSAAGPPPEGWPYAGWPYRVTRGRRMRDGSVQPVEVEVHPDPRVQAFLEQLREAEVVQSADRVRPIFHRRRLILLNALCLDVTYDRVLSHAEILAGGTRLERAWEATGILPLGARDLSLCHRRFFPSAAVARDALKRVAESGGVFQIVFYLGSPPTFSYRRAAQRGSPSRALIDLVRHRDPQAALEALLGPLMWFRSG